ILDFLISLPILIRVPKARRSRIPIRPLSHQLCNVPQALIALPGRVLPLLDNSRVAGDVALHAPSGAADSGAMLSWDEDAHVFPLAVGHREGDVLAGDFHDALHEDAVGLEVGDERNVVSIAPGGV